jgi:hypothetical protein
MGYYPGVNPVVGILILLTLLYVLLRVNNIDITEIFAPGRFTEIYTENPLIIIVTISVIVYTSYVIYRTLTNSSEKYQDYREKFGNINSRSIVVSNQNTVTPEKQNMSFDRFYQTFIMVKTVELVPNNFTESELSNVESEMYSYYSESEINSREKVTYLVPNNKVIIFRTSIDGIKYYLVMDSILEQNLPYRKTNMFQNVEYADKAAICKIGGITDRYVSPILLREDLLDQDYKSFIDKAFSSVSQAIEIKKALDNINNGNSQTIVSRMETSNTPNNKTMAQNILQYEILPRFIHHFSMIRHVPSTESLSLSDVISSESYIQNREEQQNKQMPEKYCYTMGGYLKDQLSDITQLNTESQYMVNLSKNFSPYTEVRKEEILSINNNPTSETTKINKEFIDIVNDRKFVCSSQTIDVVKYSEIYATTVTPSIDMVDNIVVSLDGSSNSSLGETVNSEGKQTMKPKISDAFILEGKNNTKIIHLDPNVNLYVLGDFKDVNNVATNNIKCWFARLDSYVDPTINTSSVISTDTYNDKMNPYYMKPKMYNVGIIPDDYKQCRTLPDGSIDSYCRGDKYINGVDYSDARKIDFEVVTVQLNSI